MPTTYVLDTSVLLADPSAIDKFDEHEVVIPIVVISELEGKRDHPELGYFARAALRAIGGPRGRRRSTCQCRCQAAGGNGSGRRGPDRLAAGQRPCTARGPAPHTSWSETNSGTPRSPARVCRTIASA
jgi:hypothetical protein